MREPAAFYVRSRDYLYVVANDPDCNLSVLPDEPPAPEVVPVHLLDCPKDGFDYTALVVLCHELVKVVPVGPGHLAPGLAAAVLAGRVGFGLDAGRHAHAGYRVAYQSGQVGRVQAKVAVPVRKPSNMGHMPVMSEAYPSVT